MQVSQLIGSWYDSHKRSLPWRENPEPYRIWLSEIILQQTRVNQGMPYYTRFTERFPTLRELADASLDAVLLAWEGLGYYNRAHNLHRAAQTIRDEHQGIFPSDYSSIRALPGIGDYTAAAIASLAFNLPYAAVDGNVYRVLSRILGIPDPVDTSSGKKTFQNAANSLLDRQLPGRHNQAMIELGALVCLPKNPQCSSCPVQHCCWAFKEGITRELPTKNKKSRIRNRYFHYLAIWQDHNLYIKQRNAKDIWPMLYELPLIETPHPAELETLMLSREWQTLFHGTKVTLLNTSRSYLHKLSHQHIHARFYKIKVEPDYTLEEYRAVPADEFNRYAFPKLILSYFNTMKQ